MALLGIGVLIMIVSEVGAFKASEGSYLGLASFMGAMTAGFFIGLAF